MSWNEKTLNVGFLGVGNLVSKQHLPNAHACPHLRVHTLCDLDVSRLEQYTERYSPAKSTTDYREMLADPEIDIVVIAMDPEMHAPVRIEALRAGKHVYVEKPLTEDIETGLEVADVVRDSGLYLAVGFNRRFAPSYADAFGIIEHETEPVMITYRMVDDFRDRPVKWVGRPRLLDECCHVFDVFNWLARSDPRRVFATGIGRKEDHQVIVEYDNGITASMFTSSCGAFHWPKEKLEIVGSHKVLAVEDFVELQTAGVSGWKDKRYRGREYDGFTKGYAHLYEALGLPFYREMRSTAAELLLGSGLIESEPDREKWGLIGEMYPDHLRIPINYSVDKGWYDALAHFGRNILDGATPRNAGPVDSLKAMAVSIAAMRSVESGQPVDIDSVWMVS